jgi:hypothetical protein
MNNLYEILYAVLDDYMIRHIEREGAGLSFIRNTVMNVFGSSKCKISVLLIYILQT